MQRQLRQEQAKNTVGGADANANPTGPDSQAQQEQGVNAEPNELVINQNDEKLYLIDPEKRSDPALPDEILDQI